MRIYRRVGLWHNARQEKSDSRAAEGRKEQKKSRSAAGKAVINDRSPKQRAGSRRKAAPPHTSNVGCDPPACKIRPLFTKNEPLNQMGGRKKAGSVCRSASGKRRRGFPGELQSPTRRGQVHVFGQGSPANSIHFAPKNGPDPGLCSSPVPNTCNLLGALGILYVSRPPNWGMT